MTPASSIASRVAPVTRPAQAARSNLCSQPQDAYPSGLYSTAGEVETPTVNVLVPFTTPASGPVSTLASSV